MVLSVSRTKLGGSGVSGTLGVFGVSGDSGDFGFSGDSGGSGETGGEGLVGSGKSGGSGGSGVLIKLNGRLNKTHVLKSAARMETVPLSDVAAATWSASAIATKANVLAKTDKIYRRSIGLSVGNEKPRAYWTLVLSGVLHFSLLLRRQIGRGPHSCTTKVR